MKLVALYFSGTGNTRYVVKRIATLLAKTMSVVTVNIEDFTQDSVKQVEQADMLLFGYPIYGSIAPFIMRQFVKDNSKYFRGKKATVIVTQVSFSGDGGAYLARLLRTYNVEVVAIEHFNMPNNISDSSIFKIKSELENIKILEKADLKIDAFAEALAEGAYKTVGDNVFSRLLGSVQRVPFRVMERKLRAGVKIDKELCNHCALCVELCPMSNLTENSTLIRASRNCTLCYRCVNLCPQKAISIFSKKKPLLQYKGIN